MCSAGNATFFSQANFAVRRTSKKGRALTKGRRSVKRTRTGSPPREPRRPGPATNRWQGDGSDAGGTTRQCQRHTAPENPPARGGEAGMAVEAEASLPGPRASRMAARRRPPRARAGAALAASGMGTNEGPAVGGNRGWRDPHAAIGSRSGGQLPRVSQLAALAPAGKPCIAAAVARPWPLLRLPTAPTPRVARCGSRAGSRVAWGRRVR